MDSGFCVTKVLVELWKKGVFGAALMKKRIYWPENINCDAIDAHFALKEVENVDAVKKLEDGVGLSCILHERSRLINEAHDYIWNIGSNT